MNRKTMTIDEKLTLLTGYDCWYLERLGDLPRITFSDGPHGVKIHQTETEAKWDKAVAFPTLSALASTWDPALAHEMGQLLGDEAIEKNIDVLLAPGINIKRMPYNGRNFEYFSEDPYLAGEMAYAYIEGVQSKGIGTSVKHFAVNNSDHDRFYQSSEVDDRTLHEIYLPAFARAVEAKPYTVMCSYNLLNGVYCSEHRLLLHDILRGEMGFDGAIISDWGAVVDRAKALKATLDLEMPHSDEAFPNLKAAYERGYITDEEIDAAVDRLLALVERIEENKKKRVVTTTPEERHKATVRIAAEAAVLLKNDGALPLKDGQKVFVCGCKARTGVYGGGGSAEVASAFEPVNLMDCIQAENATLDLRYRETHYYPFGTSHRFHNLRGSIAFAEQADAAVVVVGFDAKTDCEAGDRMTLRLTPLEEELIRRVGAANPNTTVVVYGGSAVDMSNWIGCVNAVVFTNFNGEGGNEALGKLLTGRENFSGRLQESFPYEDSPNVVRHGDGYTDVYAERVFVGYRGYDARGEEVLFPFGYGLSYSAFDYSALRVEEKDGGYEVSVKVKNTSAVAGKEVVQLYVGQKHPLVARPPHELKRFRKIALKAGEEQCVTFSLTRRDLAYWSPAIRDWRVEDGSYTVFVGSSSRDLKLSAGIEVALPHDEQNSQRIERW